MRDIDLEQIDQALEAAMLLRSSEQEFARQYRRGSAFSGDGDRRRLDAFTLGMFDALSEMSDFSLSSVKVFAYMFGVVRYGPGSRARESMQQLLALASVSCLQPYVAGGKRIVFRMICGMAPEVGHFSRLLEQELEKVSHE